MTQPSIKEKLLSIQKGNNYLLKLSFVILAIVSLFLMIWSSKYTAISGDEFRYINQSEKVYNYFASGGEDKSAITKTGVDPQHYNSQSFDVLAYIIEKKLGIKDTFKFRHGLNAITGWLTILFAALVAIDLFGIHAGLFTFILLLISPRFIGHSFNNHRDIPLALSFIFTSYWLLKYLKKYPKISFKIGALIVLGIGSAFSLRLAGGILLSAFVLFFISVYHITKTKFKKLFNLTSFKILAKHTSTSIIIVMAGFGLGLLVWPFGLEEPIKNSLEVLKASSNLGVSLNQLFEGKLVQSNTIPWYYTPKFMLISIPLVVFLGISLFFILHAISRFKYFKREQIIVLFMGILPIIYTIISTKNDYGGWRHFIFVYPFLVVLAGIGFDLILKIFENKSIRIASLALFSVLSLSPGLFIIKNHPYQYVYFNELVGKVGKAYKTYESDYSCNGVYGGAHWIIENIIPELEMDEKITIVTNARAEVSNYLKEYQDQTNIVYSRYYEKSKKEWDYGIFYCGYISPKQLEDNLWPPKGTIHIEDVEGFPIGAVVKRISDEGIKGFNAMKKNKIAEAKTHFKNFLAVYPENEEVLEGYARAMLNERKYDSTIVYADSALLYNPRQIGAYLLKASALNNQKKYNEALMACNNMLNIKEEFAEGLFQKGFALKNLNKPNEALKAFQTATSHKKDYYQAMMQMGDILTNYKNYKKALDIYNQVFKFKKNDLYATVYSAKCYHLLKDNKKADELLKSLPERHQNNLYAVMVKFRIAMSKNDMTNAGRYLQMARNVQNNAELFVLRAMYVSKQNKTDLAKQYLDKAVELDGTNQEAKAMVKTLKTAKSGNPAIKKSTQPQQSIMFKKPEPKKNTGPIQFPVK